MILQRLTFEQTKLLEEKGFDWEMEYVKGNTPEEGYFAPTQALVCKWLRDVHGLCISTRPWLPDDSNPKGQYEYFIYKDMDEDNPLYEDDSFRDTYEQAEEAGIEYCLKNLM